MKPISRDKKEGKRSAGVLLAVSSLPSQYGIGTFGRAAREWVDFLERAGQSFWQILPLGPTSWGDSPYMSFSAFAISPYYIDLETLCDQGLLEKSECEGLEWEETLEKADYALLYKNRTLVLNRAFMRFSKNSAQNQEFQQFCMKNAFWLDDYCLFMAIKSANSEVSWLEWEENARLRKPDALKRYREDYADLIEYFAFTQFAAFSQWREIKKYAEEKNISIIGDMPIYVALDSADVWANGRLFQLDETGKPARVAGCPPDAFAPKGQLWGNPLYNWSVMAENGYIWWIARLKQSLSLYDVVRIDHFRGFESYFSIPFGAPDARSGEWVKGPGLDFIKTLNKALPDASIIAEDLGYLTPEVRNLLAESGYPGMKVLQFAFDSRENSDYMPYFYPRNCVVYTGTHDNTTVLDWFKTARPEDAALAKEFFGVQNDADGVWAYIRTALSCVANLAIIPLQDYLELGGEARMNAPSTLGGNWQWRLRPDALNDALAGKIRRLTSINGRIV
jgi:4-alpha-glucanotransferase